MKCRFIKKLSNGNAFSYVLVILFVRAIRALRFSYTIREGERDIIEFRNKEKFRFLLFKFTRDGENVLENRGNPVGKFLDRASYLLLRLHVFPTTLFVPSFGLHPVTL